MRRVLYGLAMLMSSIISTTTLITFTVICILDYYITCLDVQMFCSTIALFSTSGMTLMFFILFVRACRKTKKKTILKGIFKDLKGELNAIDVMSDCYLTNKGENNKGNELQIKVESLADMIEKSTENSLENASKE